MTSLGFHARALYETARSLTLVHLADTGHAIAAWAETRDWDAEWAEHHTLTEGR